MEDEWVDVDADNTAFEDSLKYLDDWIKVDGRSVTMLAQLMCIAAIHYDGLEAGSVLKNNIDNCIKDEAN